LLENRLSEKQWKVPTSGAGLDASTSHPMTGATGSWTCTTSKRSAARARRSSESAAVGGAQLDTAPLAGKPTVRPSGRR